MKNERQSRCGHVRDVRNENDNNNKCCGHVVRCLAVEHRVGRKRLASSTGRSAQVSAGDPGTSTDGGTTMAGVAFDCRPLSMVFVGAGCQLNEVPRECCTNGRGLARRYATCYDHCHVGGVFHVADRLCGVTSVKSDGEASTQSVLPTPQDRRVSRLRSEPPFGAPLARFQSFQCASLRASGKDGCGVTCDTQATTRQECTAGKPATEMSGKNMIIKWKCCHSCTKPGTRDITLMNLE